MPQQRKRNGEPTVRQDKLSKQNVILYLCGIIPVVWLGLLIAPCLKDGLPGLVQQFGSVMQNPFQIQLCEDSVKTVLTLPWRCRRWAMWAESPIGHGTASAAAWSGAPASSAGARTNAAISTPVSFPSSPDVSTVYSGSGSVDSGRITPWSPRPA